MQPPLKTSKEDSQKKSASGVEADLYNIHDQQFLTSIS